MAEVDLGRVQGFSAYEVAKQNGYVGTEAQWLESLHGPKGDDGAPGKDGVDGASAGFGTPMASVDANVGTPSVTIEASGSNAAKVFKFIFKNLKGEKGDKGERGPAGSVVVDDALSSTSENAIQNKVVKAEFDQVNSNLSQLELSDVAGGKNLFNPNYLLNATYDENTDTITVSNNTEKALDIVFKENTQYTFSAYVKQSDSNTNIRFNIIYTDGTEDDVFLFSQSTTEAYVSRTSESGKTISEVKWTWGSGGTATFRNLQIEEGTVATDYEPYIPSIVMLTEENAQQNNSLSSLGKCKNLLKPTLQTTTQNGLTCTNNGDGTYTLNGTATAEIDILIGRTIKTFKKNTKLKIAGMPTTGKAFVYDSFNSFGENSFAYGFEGKEYQTNVEGRYSNCNLHIPSGASLSNIIIRPMITTNLNATYDDFVPYTGDGDTLTADVASLKSDLTNLKDGTTPAAKAVADEDGNNIKSTYAKKTEIPGGGSTAENVTVVAVSGVSQSVINNSKCKNDRVVLGFYITVVAGNYNTIRIADITSNHGPTEVVYGTAVCTTKYSGFDEYTKPYPFQINKAKSIYLKINETFATDMTFYISLAYDV